MIVEQVTEGDLSVGNQPADVPVRSLFGVPLVVSSAVPVVLDEATGNAVSGELLIVDKAQVVSAVGPIRVETSEHAAFTRDSLLRRITWRLGWSVVRPDRTAKRSSTLA